MVPMLESVGRARALVEYCRYRPLGTRGLAFGGAHDDYRGGPVTEAIAPAGENSTESRSRTANSTLPASSPLSPRPRAIWLSD